MNHLNNGGVSHSSLWLTLSRIKTEIHKFGSGSNRVCGFATILLDAFLLYKTVETVTNGVSVIKHNQQFKTKPNTKIIIHKCINGKI